jgi:hypothetical protein
MINSPYQQWFGTAIDGLEPRDAFKKHMTRWLDVLQGRPAAEVYYYYQRLKNRQVDSLNQKEIRIGALSFPVYFRVDAPPQISDHLQRNFHSMLISTGFPLCPANEIGFVYPFDMVEEPVDLPWLHVPMLQGRRNVSYEMLTNPKDYEFVAMREKKDGVPFVGVTLGGLHYLVGSFWFHVRFPCVQAEWLRNTAEFKVLYPYMPSTMHEGLFELTYSKPVPYRAKVATDYDEGVMIFVAHKGVVQECRLKRQNTCELLIKSTKVEGIDQIFEVPDGIWECAYREGMWYPLKERPGKVPMVRLSEKMLLQPTLLSLKATAHPPSKFLFVRNWVNNGNRLQRINSSEGFAQRSLFSGGAVLWWFLYDWEFTEGEVSERRFHYKMSEVVAGKKGVAPDTIHTNWSSAEYCALSQHSALVRGGERTNGPVLNEESQKGVALLSIRGTDIGVLSEAGKLYTLPGGKIKEQEKIWDALNRELNEELPPGWRQVEAYGPFVSGQCTYFVTMTELSGLVYRPSTSQEIHPYVRRVYDHWIADINQSSKNVFFEEAWKNFNPTCSYLDYFSTGPKSVYDMSTKYGPEWMKNTGTSAAFPPLVVLGKMVYLASAFATAQKRVALVDKCYAGKVEMLIDCPPKTFLEIMECWKTTETETKDLLKILRMKLINDYYCWAVDDED